MEKSAQFSFVELSFLMILLSFGLSFVDWDVQTISIDHKFQIESALSSLYHDESLRSLVMGENLSDSTINGNWTNISNVLDDMFLSYEIGISNVSDSKVIFSCNSDYSKYYDERVLGVSDGSFYEFRTVKLGVCY